MIKLEDYAIELWNKTHNNNYNIYLKKREELQQIYIGEVKVLNTDSSTSSTTGNSTSSTTGTSGSKFNNLYNRYQSFTSTSLNFSRIMLILTQ